MVLSVLAASWTEFAYVVVQNHLRNIVFLCLTPANPVRGALCVSKHLKTIVFLSLDTYETCEGYVLCHEAFKNHCVF